MKANTEQNLLSDLPFGLDLTEQQARAIYEQGEEAVVFALLKLAKMAAEHKLTNTTARYRLKKVNAYIR